MGWQQLVADMGEEARRQPRIVTATLRLGCGGSRGARFRQGAPHSCAVGNVGCQEIDTPSAGHHGADGALSRIAAQARGIETLRSHGFQSRMSAACRRPPPLARLRLTNPKITEQAIELIYLARVPDAAYQDSCIFHGKRGCTLDRSLRADICNTYFCGGLRAYMRGQADPEPTVVLAGEGGKMRASPVLMPDREV